MKDVFEFLKEYDFISRKGINIPMLDSLSSSDIIELGQVLTILTELKDPDISHNHFTHAASASLSGQRSICEGLDCRLTKIAELARFALMYSDRVYIENPFSDYEHFSSDYDEDELKIRFYEDLQVLLAIRPLLKKRFLVFFTPQEHYCMHCVEHALGIDIRKRVRKGLKELSKQYLENTTASLVQLDEDSCQIEYSGSELYLEHEIVLRANRNYRDVTGILSSMPRILKQLKEKGRVSLSQHIQKRLATHTHFARKVTNTVTQGIMTSKFLRASFLTDRDIDISFLNTITGDPTIENRNSIAFKHLTSIVPFIEDVKIEGIIKIREREEDAFIQYRRALNEAIDEFRSSGNTFKEKDARTLYSDVIAPKLAALDQRVNQAKRDLVTKSYRSIIAVVGAISFGIYTGLIPTELAEFAKVIGFTKIATDILEKVLPLGDAANTIKNEDLYFLWRTRGLRE